MILVSYGIHNQGLIVYKFVRVSGDTTLICSVILLLGADLLLGDDLLLGTDLNADLSGRVLLTQDKIYLTLKLSNELLQ